ncbi:MAG: VWA domain-containing protein [Hyphomicrobiaceae bacterium]|nr:VWA domain-containing protein [Hyphomicrobiaceae bacterium]
MLFGLTLIPVVAFAGYAVDYANAYRVRAKLQNALDSATLAVGREVDAGTDSGAARQVGKDVLSANLGENFPAYSVNFQIDGTLVTATADVDLPTYILGVIGHKKWDIGITSVVNVSNGTIEVALVLDNSGSMSGSKIADLRDAAQSLTEILFEAQRDTSGVSIGLVPFAGAVNVGTQHANAVWMDTTGQSSIHFENFDSTARTRFQVFNAMRNTSWGGCVEVRPSPHDVTDSAPAGGDSLFVPYFAPDEPDSRDSRNSSSYTNNYLDDDEGSCPTPPNNETQVQAQEKTCKYDNERSDSSSRGPNYRCTSRPILPLSDNESEIVTAIQAMGANGMTNIHQGLMWGWRVLSSDQPFTEGRTENDATNRKFMVVMTDGKNTHTGRSHQNRSAFSAYGFSKNGRLRSPTSSTSNLESAMNTKTETSCTNAKASGITIYTIAVEVPDQATIDMLRRCASGDQRAFSIEDSDALNDVFEAIADEINKLRITS